MASLALDGGLTISSTPGEGTTVDLWLPASPVGATDEEEALAEPAYKAGRGTALLVDHGDLARMSTADILINISHEVVEARSAEEAGQTRRGKACAPTCWSPTTSSKA